MRLYSYTLLSIAISTLCLVQGIPLQQPITFTPNSSGLRTDSVNTTIIKSGTFSTSSKSGSTIRTGKPPLFNHTTAEQQYQSSWRARNDSPSQVPMAVKAAAETVTVTKEVTATPTFTPPLLSDLPIFSFTASNRVKVAASAQQTMSYLPIPLFPSTSIRPASQSTGVIRTNSSGTGTIKAASTPKATGTSTKKSCFPALNFKMPATVPDSLDGWWCNQEDEYAFLGFSYEVTACQSQTQLNKEFLDQRNTFNARYVRLYGACDDAGFYDRVIEAAWNAGLGVHSLIWFGFDQDDSWKARRKALFHSLKNNPRAPFVTRSVQFGSEPLFDYAIDPTDLATQMLKAKKSLANQQIPIIVSDLVWAFGNRMADGAQKVIDAADYLGLHMLPYFAQNATTGSMGWWNNMSDMKQMLGYTNSAKKLIWTENGWPSTHYCPGVCPNSKNAVSSVKTEKWYYKTLDANCAQLKKFPKGGVGWFAHIYSDTQEPGYGIYDTSGNMKFDFAPQTSC